MPIPFLNSIKLNKNQVEDFCVYNISPDPTLTSAGDFGYLWLNTSDSPKTLKWWDGANIRSIVDSTNISSFTAGLATDLAGGGAGQVVYQHGSNDTQFLAAGSAGQVLSSNGTSAPSWLNQSSLSVGSATSLNGGANGSIAVQSGVGTTGFLSVGTAGQVITSNGTTPQYVDQSSLSVGSATTAGSVTNALTAGTYLTSGGTYNGSVARTFAVDATDANTASKVVARDASGNFAAGTITAATVTGLSAPTLGSDATNKDYVDGVVQGLDIKASCLVASTTDITLSAPGAITIDGVVASTDFTTGVTRILVKDQSAPAENGIYIWQGPSAAMTRSADANTWDELVAAFTFIERGTANADSGWVCNVNAGGTLGTTAVTWTKFSQAGSYTAGNGMVLSGGAFSFAQSSAYTAGRIPFASSTSAIGFSSNLHWDNSNNRLGIGTATPVAALQSTTNIVASNHDYTASFVAPTVGLMAANDSGSAWIRIATYNANATHDPYLNFLTSGGQNWSIGIDNSASDSLKFAMANGFNGTNEFLTLDSSGYLYTAANGRIGVGAVPFAGVEIASSGPWTNSNVYPFPSGNAFLKVQGVSAQDNWIGIVGNYGATSGSANLILQANLNNTTQQAGHYIGSEALTATTSELAFGKLMGGATTGVNATKTRQLTLDTNGYLYTAANGRIGVGLSPQFPLDVDATGITGFPLRLKSASGTSIRLDTGRNFGGVNRNFIVGVDEFAEGVFSIGASTTLGGTTFSSLVNLTAAGNLGLGVTPKAWRTSVLFRAFQIGYTGALYGLDSSEQVNLSSNYYQDTSGNELRIQNGYVTRYQQASGAHIWSSAGTGNAGVGFTLTPHMTLDASGRLGVGTASPDVKLTINNGYSGYGGAAITSDGAIIAAAGLRDNTIRIDGGVYQSGVSTANLHLSNSAANNYNALNSGFRLQANYNGGTGAGFFSIDSSSYTGTAYSYTTRLTLDSSGNLGLGVTPSAWSGIGPVLQVEQASLVSEASNQLYLTANAYFASGNWNYINNSQASQYYQAGGAHVWRSAAASTGIVSFTPHMTLDASGRLMVNTTTPYAFVTAKQSSSVDALTLDSDSATTYTIQNFRINGVQKAQIFCDYADGSMVYRTNTSGSSLSFGTNNAERLRIKSTGQLNFTGLAADPAGAAGDLYYSTGNYFKWHNGTAWQTMVRKVSVVGGAGTGTYIDATHNFNTKTVSVTVLRTTDNVVVFTDVAMTDDNTVRVTFASTVTLANYTVTVIG